MQQYAQAAPPIRGNAYNQVIWVYICISLHLLSLPVKTFPLWWNVAFKIMYSPTLTLYPHLH